MPLAEGLERDEAPNRHDEADGEKPVRTRRTEVAFLTLGLGPFAVLPNGESIAGQHRQTHRKDHQHQQSVQIEDLDDVDVTHDGHGRSGARVRLPRGFDTLVASPHCAIRGCCS